MIFGQTLTGRAARRSIVIGAVVALVVLVGGVFYALNQHRVWTAESMLVVLPATDLDQATSASYYETLSRGQIVATFAEVAGGSNFKQQAENRLSLTPDERASVTTEVTVVPNTSVILIRSTAPTAELAQRMVEATTQVSVQYLASLSQPYRVVPVPTGQNSAVPSGISPIVLIAASVVVALVAGVAVQQAVYHLTPALRGAPPNGRAGGVEPAGTAAPAAEDEAPATAAP